MGVITLDSAVFEGKVGASGRVLRFFAGNRPAVARRPRTWHLNPADPTQWMLTDHGDPLS